MFSDTYVSLMTLNGVNNESALYVTEFIAVYSNHLHKLKIFGVDSLTYFMLSMQSIKNKWFQNENLICCQCDIKQSKFNTDFNSKLHNDCYHINKLLCFQFDTNLL